MKGENEGAKYDYLNENQDNPTITKLKQYTTLVLIYLYVQYINTGATQLQLAVEHTRMYRTKSTSICALKHDFPIMTLCAVTNGNQLQIQERTYAKSSSLCGKFSFVEQVVFMIPQLTTITYTVLPRRTQLHHMLRLRTQKCLK